jgi:hypothetical protein
MSKKWASNDRDRLLVENFKKFMAERDFGPARLKEHVITDNSADINDMDTSAVWNIMTGQDGQAAMSLLSTIGSATKWGTGALKKAGLDNPESLKKAALQIWKDEGTFSSRVQDLVSKLNAAEGFPKEEMPALEGGDVDAVIDVLGEPGEYNVDIGPDFGGDEPDFDDYVAKLRSAKAKSQEKVNEISNDPRFPFEGPAKVMPGAPNLGSKGEIDLSAISGEAEAFLKKGKDTGGDDLRVHKNKTLKNANMKPTQKNVKAAKSMLFALLDVGADMGGAFASSEGEIIDGHHRWSGQWLRTGGNKDMTGVNIVDKGKMNTKEFLTMLTAIGTALGRPTKLKQE